MKQVKNQTSEKATKSTKSKANAKETVKEPAVATRVIPASLVKKVRANALEDFQKATGFKIEKWHHILEAEKHLVIFIWDTREISAILDKTKADTLSESTFIKYVKDSGDALVDKANLVKASMELDGYIAK